MAYPVSKVIKRAIRGILASNSALNSALVAVNIAFRIGQKNQPEANEKACLVGIKSRCVFNIHIYICIYMPDLVGSMGSSNMG